MHGDVTPIGKTAMIVASESSTQFRETQTRRLLAAESAIRHSVNFVPLSDRTPSRSASAHRSFAPDGRLNLPLHRVVILRSIISRGECLLQDGGD